jgi:hypothetical protein
MVDFCASDGAFLTFIAASIASAMLLAPLSDGGPDESRPTTSGGILEDLARVGAGLRTIQRIVAHGAVCRDNAPH